MEDGSAKVAHFSVATSRKYTNKAGETVDNTEWHRCTVWGRKNDKTGRYGLADVIEDYVTKGKQVYVEGSIKSSSYEKDGVTMYSSEVVVQNLQLLGRKGDNGNGDTEAETPF